ncbi:MAG: ATP-binding protein [Trueperaceae bacterium]
MNDLNRLVDREYEQVQLLKLLEGEVYRMALVTGRRRVGKTFLLTHTWGERKFFLFTAANVTGELNRVQLLRDLADWTGEDIRPEDYPTWRTVFRLLLELNEPQQVVVVLDEFQYLAGPERGLAEVASELNAEWERRRQQRSFLLVLAGSAVGTMEALAGGGAPLYGRFSWQHSLRPFDYWNAAKMLPFETAREKALAYGIFGGTPRYLAAIDGGLDLTGNAQRLMLAPDGEIRALVETAIEQEEGLREVAQYRSIVRAVASGNTLRNEISNATGLENNRTFRAKLDKLVELGYFEGRRNMFAGRSEPVRYYAADPALRFHQRFIEPNVSALERYSADRVWREKIEPYLDTYMGHEFERLVQQAYDRLAGKMKLPLVVEWGRWEGSDRNRRSLEFDVVARLGDSRCLTGSIKWNRKPIGAKVLWDHLGMLERARDSGLAWAAQALEPDAPMLFAAAGGCTSGFQDAVTEVMRTVYLLDLETVYDGALAG